MVTHGHVIFRFHGRYYTIHNHWDSYPRGLGWDLASSIPADKEGYVGILAFIRYSTIPADNCSVAPD